MNEPQSAYQLIALLEKINYIIEDTSNSLLLVPHSELHEGSLYVPQLHMTHHGFILHLRQPQMHC